MADMTQDIDGPAGKLHEPIPDTYSCGECGRRDGLDCVIPHRLWNQIEAETGHGVLCAWCLDRECEKRGWQVRAMLAFVGKAISAGTDPDNDDPHWEKHLGDLNARCYRAEQSLDHAYADGLAAAAKFVCEHQNYRWDEFAVYLQRQADDIRKKG